MLLKRILEMMVACFSVFGFYCALQMLMDRIFSVQRFWVTVKIKDASDADVLDMLLHEAKSAFFRKTNARTVVLISSTLFEDGTMGSADGVLYDHYADLIEHFDAECYIMDFE